MAGEIWVIGEGKRGSLSRASAEIATIGRSLSEESGRPVRGVIAGAAPHQLAAELAGYLPRVTAIDISDASSCVTAGSVAPAIAALVELEHPAYLLLAATPDGRDLTGALSALLGWGVLVNATGVSWGPGGPLVETSILAGSVITDSELVGDRGLITIRQGAVVATSGIAPGTVETAAPIAVAELPRVPILGREESPPGVVAIEDAAIVVVGGRGVGGPEGFVVLGELATCLGGTVGGTRAAVDSGWVDYSRQIGQTGKLVKPHVYLGLGVSGQVQHAVGMRGADIVIAINRDPEAPIAELADLLVVGDLHEIVPAVISELRARSS